MAFTWSLDQFDASGKPKTPPVVPAALAVTGLGYVTASGYQIYYLGADRKWTFSRPDARLFIPDPTNVEGTWEVGTHFGVLNGSAFSPNWKQTYNPGDNSQIQAKKVAEVASDDPATTIPWLKLEVTAHSGSGSVNAGKGVFGGTQQIQRIQTSGGVAPSGVQSAFPVGALLHMPYTATYTFWGATVSSTGGL